MDGATIARAKAGERAAAGKLYDCYYDRIFRYLAYRVSDVQTAEDLTEEVFVRMMRALPNYRQKRGTFQAWLFQIARNLAIDYARKAHRRQHVALSSQMKSTARSPEAAAASSLNADLLQRRGLEALRDVLAEWGVSYE